MPSRLRSFYPFPPSLPPPFVPAWSHSDPLHVTLTPKKLKTGIGSTVILSCALTGSPEFTIRWYRNTELVLPGEAISIRGLSNETLLISSAQKSHSGAYQCFATRKAQTAQDFAIIVLEGERVQVAGKSGAGVPPRGAVHAWGVCAVLSAHKAGPMPSCQLCKGPMRRSFLMSPILKVKHQGFGGMSSEQRF